MGNRLQSLQDLKDCCIQRENKKEGNQLEPEKQDQGLPKDSQLTN